jgi:two-component system LytT family response regulator
MKAFIVEDSRMAREELKELLITHDNIQLCGEASNPRDALPLLFAERPELLFLDINMPGKNGFQLLEELDYEPKVIFITAYEEFALRSFEFTTVDYVLKPISANRLKTAIDRLTLYSDASPDSEENQTPLDINSRVLLREGNNCHWVCLQDISYFESCGNYTQVYWASNKALIYRAMSKIEKRLPEKYFFRANRQHIVNVNVVESVDSWGHSGYRLQLKSANEIDVSRRHSIRFRELFSL